MEPIILDLQVVAVFVLEVKLDFETNLADWVVDIRFLQLKLEAVTCLIGAIFLGGILFYII